LQVVVRDREREDEVRRLVEEATKGVLPLVKGALGKRVWRADGFYVKAHEPKKVLERLKQFFIGARAKREFYRSIGIQNRGVRCANPVGYVVYRRTGTSYLVMEGEEGRDLGEELRSLDGAERAALLRRLAAFIRQMHAAGIHHRDLHPGNILVRDSDFCLLDTVKCCLRKGLRISHRVFDLAQLAWGVWTVAGEEAARVLVTAYWGEDRTHIEATMRRARRHGRRRFRSRSRRCVKESTQFCRVRMLGWRLISRRDLVDRLEHWLMVSGSHPEGVFCKRRSYRGPWGALRLLLGLGRMLRAWKAAHRMVVAGVPTVAHLAYGRRVGFFCSEEVLFMERADSDLQRALWRCIFEGRREEMVALGQAAGAAVRQLIKAGLWHGDMKAQNLLVKGDCVLVGDAESLMRRGLTNWRVAEMLGQMEASLPRCLPLRSRLRIALSILRDTPYWESRKGIITRAGAIAEQRRQEWIALVARRPIRSTPCASSTSTATTG